MTISKIYCNYLLINSIFTVYLGPVFYGLNLFLGQSNIVDLHLGDPPFEVPAIANFHSHSYAVLRGQLKIRANVHRLNH